MSAYYYLLSGLKEYNNIDDTGKSLDLLGVSNSIVEQLNDKDKLVFKYLVYQNDNKNLSSVLANKSNLFSPYSDWQMPSFFENSILEHPNNYFSELPLYMQSFLESNAGKSFLSIADIENALLSKFHKEIASCGSSFLVDYFSFMVDFKNIMTAVNLRMLGYAGDEIRKNLLGEGSLVDALSRSTSSDFGVSREYPYIAKIVDAVEAKDPYVLEKVEMDVVFEYLAEKSASKYFQLENVLAYYIKCTYIARLSNRDVKAGEEAIKTLMAEIKKELDNVKV